MITILECIARVDAGVDAAMTGAKDSTAGEEGVVLGL